MTAHDCPKSLDSARTMVARPVMTIKQTQNVTRALAGAAILFFDI
jgi:hypothetical protein